MRRLSPGYVCLARNFTPSIGPRNNAACRLMDYRDDEMCLDEVSGRPAGLFFDNSFHFEEV